MESAREIIAEARKRITVAADYTRDEQLGKAIMRMEDLYAKCMASGDLRSAIQAQKELNRLLALYETNSQKNLEGQMTEREKVLQEQLDVISSYLKPLKLVSEDYPVFEHARVAANRLWDLDPRCRNGGERSVPAT